MLQVAPELRQAGLTGSIHLGYRNESLLTLSFYQPLAGDTRSSPLFFSPCGGKIPLPRNFAIGSKDKQNGHIYFGNKGKDSNLPYIFLDKDAGIGNVAGDNQEIITISTLAHVDCILIAANIFRFFGSFAKGESFSKYDGKVTIIPNNGNEIVVPLTSQTTGKWCIIAKIDNLDQNFPMVININDVTDNEPNIDDYILKDVLSLTYEDS